MINYNLNEAKNDFGLDYLKYLNIHPQNKIVGDCAKRAIALATDTPYKEIKLQLNRVKQKTHCKDFNDMKNIRYYLNKVITAKLVRVAQSSKGEKMLHMEDFVKMYPIGSYVVRFAGHLVACIDGCFYDTWDSSDKCIYCAWKIKTVI